MRLHGVHCVAEGEWRSFRTGQMLEPVPPDPEGLTFGKPVYTDAEIDAWAPAGAGSQYARLMSSWAGNVNRTVTNHGSAITTNEARTAIRDDAVYAKCQAVLWAANGQTARRNKVIEVLDGVKNVTSWTGQSGEINLVAGWCVTNLCQAARIIGYDPADVANFLRNVAYPMLDWPTGGNWFASFADSRLAVAALLEDETRWADAMAYFGFRIAQTLRHSTYDGSNIVPLRGGVWPGTQTSSVSASRTARHWSAEIPSAWGGESQPVHSSPFPAQYSYTYGGGASGSFADGTTCEVGRDIGHESMGLASWVQAARTIRAQNDTIPEHAWDRILANVEYHGGRSLTGLQTGVIPHPRPTAGSPAGLPASGIRGWHTAHRLLGEDTPEVVFDLFARSEVSTAIPAGANNLAAELFADGSN